MVNLVYIKVMNQIVIDLNHMYQQQVRMMKRFQIRRIMLKQKDKDKITLRGREIVLKYLGLQRDLF